MGVKKKIEDLIVIGRAAPDEISDGRQTVCVGGWSLEEDFVRIYPTNVYSALKRWNQVSIPVERNKKDTRHESWKIRGSNTGWQNLHEKIEVNNKLEKSEWIELIESLPKTDCIQDLNNAKRSLGIIRPSQIIDVYFEKRKDYTKSQQSQLGDFFDEAIDKVFRVKTKQNYPVIPKIKWNCNGPCKTKQRYHETQVLEWGVYEWIRKHEDEPKKWSQVWENLRLFDDNFEKYFFVGNLNRHRKTFVIISIIRWKESNHRDQQQESLDNFFS